MKQSRPLMLAVGGDSGTGKSTLTDGIAKLFGKIPTVNICLDDYHTLDRQGRKAAGVTALNPKANDMELMAKHCADLAEAKGVDKPVYNHSTGTFDPNERVDPGDLIIISGLFAGFNEEIRRNFDISLYLDPDRALQRAWKIKRDQVERGYTVEQVEAQIAEREPDVRDYIQPQRKYADIIVNFYPPHDYENHEDDSRLPLRLYINPELPAIDYAPILESAKERAGDGRPAVRLGDGELDGRSFTVLEIDPNIDPNTVEVFKRSLTEPVESYYHLHTESLGSFLDGTTQRRSGLLSLVQLLIASRLVAVAHVKQKTMVS